MKRLNKQAGFTLIEMAIVLVIIGILIGLVLRGSDLIANAQQKKVRDIPRKWEVPIWAYYDRNNGVFPGDAAADGLIDGQAAMEGDLDAASISRPPTIVDTVTANIQGQTGMGPGVGGVCDGSGTVDRNVMQLIGVAEDIATNLDTDIDGTLNGAGGRVRYCDGANFAAWPGTGAALTVWYFFDRVP